VYEYARHGACVAVVARTEIALRAVAKTARDLGAPDVLVVPADITKVDEAKRAVEETVAHFGKRQYLLIYIYINIVYIIISWHASSVIIYISATLLLSHMLYKCFALQVYKCTFTNACDKFTKMLCFPSA
jgi:NAD(P)-dependent dehydrogenase (short-subunit alcohol dehydrogenase family)